MLNLIEAALKYRRIFIVLIAVVFTQCLELTVLIYKYDIFSGGFLQPFSYRTIDEKLIFLVFSLWFDLVLFGVLAWLWFFVTDKFKKYGLTIYYVLTVTLVLIIGSWVAVKFKILSYFSDVINVQLIRNLGGGDLKEALLYVINEISLFIIFFIILIAVLFFLNKIINNNKYISLISEKKIDHIAYLELLVAAVIATPMIVLYISNNDYLRYGLEKKTSYRLVSGFIDTLSDFDFDGYGSFVYPRDKEVFNAGIYPGALDVPGNGIDEDGFLGDAVADNIPVDNIGNLPNKAGKHIVLIVLESARADLLNLQVRGQHVTPVINDIAKSGTAVKYAYSHTGYTITSLHALFNSELINAKKKVGLIPFLKSAGYGISIISGQDESFGNVANDTGMRSPGNYYFDARIAINDRVFPSTDAGSLRLSEERVVQEFLARMQQIDLHKAQFIYLNFQAAHFPYTHPNMAKRLITNLIPRADINAENKNWVAETYWNAIANADWAVGKVVESLSAHNILNQTTIVILGDHGESLFDDGFLGHGHAINDIQTKIPVIINDPDLKIEEPIGQTDVAEITIRSALGLPKQWADKDKVVFQLVGVLSRPTLIAHVRQEGVRTLFDFRSEQVFFSDLQLWKPYKEALTDNRYKDRVVHLIREWESLRWQEAQAKLIALKH